MNQAPRVHERPRAAKTYGDLAADLASDYGLTPDPWQQIVLDDWLAVKAGRWASLTCGLSVPRQNGKNALIEVRELFGMVGRGEKFLHTAHEVKTARKAFKRLQHFFGTQKGDPGAKFPELNALVTEVRNVNGQEAIYLSNGGSVEVVARSKNSARGFTVDVLVMDEAQEMSEDDLEALMPTTSSAPLGDPQWIFTGTPPGPSANGEIFARVRDEAMSGKAVRLAWHEWSADLEAGLDDRDEWRKVNPALINGRLQFEVIEGERARFSAEGFARERLGIWDSRAATAVFGAGRWEACAGEEVKGLPLGALSVAADRDLTRFGVVGAALDGDVTQVKPLFLGPSSSEAVEFVAGLHDAHGAPVAIDGRGPAAALIPDLERAGVNVVTLKTPDVLDACSGVFTAVSEKALRHANYPDLNAAVDSARKRDVGDRWAWGRKGDDHVVQLEAATFAHWLLTRPQEVTESAYADHDLIII